jgi:hypothetical protein
MMLTERLDGHRGQQQIIVRHVTTTNNISADQAIIAGSITAGSRRAVTSPAHFC